MPCPNAACPAGVIWARAVLQYYIVDYLFHLVNFIRLREEPAASETHQMPPKKLCGKNAENGWHPQGPWRRWAVPRLGLPTREKIFR